MFIVHLWGNMVYLNLSKYEVWIMKNIFNEHIDTSKLSRKKWEYEIERTGYDDLLSFGTADMDYHSPQPILDAIREVAEIGHLGYPHIRSSYYETIERWLERSTGWKIKAKESVIPHVGVYMSSITVMDALTNLGDEIIIQTPVHTRFTQLIKDNGRIPISNPLKRVNNRYEMDYEHLESIITAKTKILWLCNPHNPVGRAWTRDELKKLGDICLKHDLYIFTDDIYCGMVYPGIIYTPVASLSQELAQVTISCYSPSKCYNTTGANQSFVIIENEEIRNAYRKSLHKTDLDYAINIIGLAITEAAYGKCDDWLASLMVHIKKNHEFLSRYAQENMQGAVVTMTDSTYFGWIDMRSLKKSSGEIVKAFEDDAHVLANDGAALGMGGEGYIRMNLACPHDVLETGLKRMSITYDKLIVCT